MEGGTVFYLLAGLWALVMVAVFISAIRLSYVIEGRSEGLRNTSGIPRNAMILHTVLNWRVAHDPETQVMRRRMIQRLLIVVVGFFVLFAIIRAAASVGETPLP